MESLNTLNALISEESLISKLQLNLNPNIQYILNSVLQFGKQVEYTESNADSVIKTKKYFELPLHTKNGFLGKKIAKKDSEGFVFNFEHGSLFYEAHVYFFRSSNKGSGFGPMGIKQVNVCLTRAITTYNCKEVYNTFNN